MPPRVPSAAFSSASSALSLLLTTRPEEAEPMSFAFLYPFCVSVLCVWRILRGVVLCLSQLPLRGQTHGKPGGLGTFRRTGRLGPGRIRAGVEGGKCPSTPTSQRRQPPEHPSPPIRYLPTYPPQQRLGGQVQAIPPTSLSSKTPTGKPMKGRTQTEGKDPKLRLMKLPPL